MRYLFMLLLIVPMTFSDNVAIGVGTIDGWYIVEDWEVDVCSNWGGTAEANGFSAVAERDSYMYRTTVTLQAQKSPVQDSDENIIEVAWYFRPMDKDQEYTIELLGSGLKEIYQGSSTKARADANYHAEQTDRAFTHAKITYETGTLTVPIVEK